MTENSVYVNALLQEDSNGHYVRKRMNSILARAVKMPLVIVCAGMGYGKTRAVSDFTRESSIPDIWIRLSEYDNVGSSFWKNFVCAFSKLDKQCAEAFEEIGFPDTEKKMNKYFEIINRYMSKLEYLIVLDNFHLVKNHLVTRFVEQIIHNKPSNFLLVLICRDIPQIDIVRLQVSDLVALVQEPDLNFTENELIECFKQQGLNVELNILHQIMQDTGGWSVSVNLIARLLSKSPRYFGYVRSALIKNIFSLIETEAWDAASEKLRNLWARLSLIEHFSVEIIAALIGDDTNLLEEFSRQNSYIRFNNYSNAYMIHHHFIDYLQTKQGMLNDDEKYKTFKTAANWCKQNGFVLDALRYYERIKDYESIASAFSEFPTCLPYDLAVDVMYIFECAPAEAFVRTPMLAAIHLRVVACLGRWQEYFSLAAHYEQQLLKLPADDPIRNLTLGVMYFSMGITLALFNVINDHYDFDECIVKMDDCLSKFSINRNHVSDFMLGPWGSAVGSSRQGAPEESIKAAINKIKHAQRHFGGIMSGADDLFQGELLFYKNNVKAAEPLIVRALESAKERRQFDVMHRALFYIMRIAVSQGLRSKAEWALNNIKNLLNEPDYFYRFMTYDIAFGWYHYLLRQPEMVPEWLKGKFAHYIHAYVIENFGNQMKARYLYLTKNFTPILIYVDEMRKRESCLYGRVEMLAIEACARYQMKDKTGAFNVLKEAYETASPNNILMPFIELGKDMRVLTATASRDTKCKIALAWLKTVNNRSYAYAQNQARIITDYNTQNGVGDNVALSHRESEVLKDLYDGLSKSEIATKRNLSINTVKMVAKSIYDKLDANSIANIIRIVAERKKA